MRAARSYPTQAIVLKQFRLGEVDRVLTLFTPEHGKLRAVAKGACRPGSKLGGHVQPLTLSTLMLARGRNLDIVTQGQTMESFAELKNDLERSACGLYVLDLIDLFTVEGNQDSPLFDLLRETLRWLSSSKNCDALLRYFEVQLLGHVGYRPRLYRCAVCGVAVRPMVNYFSFAQGGVVCSMCGRSEVDAVPLSLGALKVLRLWQACDHSMATRVVLKGPLASELEGLLRRYMEYLLHREVKSAAWLKEVRGASA
jgi:DNA repair protein RecO (recombination protein O)